MQLIRAMKQALVKQTAEAVKRFNPATTADGKQANATRPSCRKADQIETLKDADGERNLPLQSVICTLDYEHLVYQQGSCKLTTILLACRFKDLL